MARIVEFLKTEAARRTPSLYRPESSKYIYLNYNFKKAINPRSLAPLSSEWSNSNTPIREHSNGQESVTIAGVDWSHTTPQFELQELPERRDCRKHDFAVRKLL